MLTLYWMKGVVHKFWDQYRQYGWGVKYRIRLINDKTDKFEMFVVWGSKKLPKVKEGDHIYIGYTTPINHKGDHYRCVEEIKFVEGVSK